MRRGTPIFLLMSVLMVSSFVFAGSTSTIRTDFVIGSENDVGNVESSISSDEVKSKLGYSYGETALYSFGVIVLALLIFVVVRGLIRSGRVVEKHKRHIGKPKRKKVSKKRKSRRRK